MVSLSVSERVYRYVKGSSPVTVVSVIRHPCDVIEVHMVKSGFKPRPGQNLTEERYHPLSSRLVIGRPTWRLLFQEIGKANQHKKVGVFCCGPKSVSRELHKLCNSFSSSTTVFEYNKESFS
ncbi:NADPH oxidase 4 [Bagarius yarrelli]|uniref:NADPH oxidase 4 n=1 Tax=Bagarius yarrelli TaxID=175774 RepID=A0A556TTS5_BAGYA|nr:NADPH oxidase 4 [Bagarius yarrelli]